MLVRESMAQNTNWEKFGFAPPHVFENGRQALDQLESVLPDVVITDICMPFVDGLELARNVYEKFPDTIVVVLMPRKNSEVKEGSVFRTSRSFSVFSISVCS